MSDSVAGVRPEHLARLAELGRDQADRAFTPAELAAHLGVGADWARRLLRTLVAAGWAEQADAVPAPRRGRPSPRFRLTVPPDDSAVEAEFVCETAAVVPGGSGDHRLQTLVRGWLETTYSNVGTRLAYGDALGLDRTPTAGDRGPSGRPGAYRHLAWLRWCRASQRDPLRVINADITRWQIELTRAGMTAATRDKWLKAAKSFYGFLVDRELLPTNPAALSRAQRTQLGLSGLQHKTRKPLVLTPRQVHALLAAAGRGRRGQSPLHTLRTRALVALFTLGMRVSELTGLTRDALHTTHGRRALRYTGKGGKAHTVYLTALAADALTDYLAARDRDTGDALPARPGQVHAGRTPLLATRDGGFLDRRDVWALLRRLAATAGPELADLADALHPHALRHFYVTTALESGAPIDVVSADVAHASTEVTQRSYDHATRSPARSAVDLVADAITAAGTPTSAETDRFAADLARLSDPDPLEQLDAAHALARHASDHPALAAELRTALAGRLAETDGLHPRVHQALRRLRETTSSH
ncbi:tyrosine-type recombinase/integrase [Saccharopolyspora erythraea]|uniref:tyrosine-type recombinase/integrase n=1 Tax=Saccharopolyspora erythraea TaxID=1836 RepID=UPI001BA5FE41|nr:tyrosine-type recombinase/integrase [Saccharopolyspora erythraea]QUH02916.1 tyrosine-type recombinase/integrase [Saccharopolyspora erythraea]